MAIFNSYVKLPEGNPGDCQTNPQKVPGALGISWHLLLLAGAKNGAKRMPLLYALDMIEKNPTNGPSTSFYISNGMEMPHICWD